MNVSLSVELQNIFNYHASYILLQSSTYMNINVPPSTHNLMACNYIYILEYQKKKSTEFWQSHSACEHWLYLRLIMFGVLQGFVDILHKSKIIVLNRTYNT